MASVAPVIAPKCNGSFFADDVGVHCCSAEWIGGHPTVFGADIQDVWISVGPELGVGFIRLFGHCFKYVLRVDRPKYWKTVVVSFGDSRVQ